MTWWPRCRGRATAFDFAPIESFWGSLKNERGHHSKYATRTEAEGSIRECIEIFYNRQRRQKRLGNQSPAVFAQNHRKQQRAA
jgi:transposase InsO family protein